MSDKSKRVQTNEVAWSAPPPTVATTNLQNMVDHPVDYSTPIRNQYARAEQARSNSYANPLGAFQSADVQGKMQAEQNSAADQNLGLDLSNAAQQSSGDQFNRQATVAGLTQPRMYGSKSTSADKMTTQDWIQMGMGAASGF